jgi:hypothetical protein
MTEERRYQDEEIRAIFGAAAEPPEAPEPPGSAGAALPASTGLTLSELRSIGQ